MADLEAVKWAGNLSNRLFGLRQAFRSVAAQTQTFQGQVNAMTAQQKSKVATALTSMGLDSTILLAELATLVTLSNTVMASVGDGSEPV